MTDLWFLGPAATVLTGATAVGAAAVGGVFLAFSGIVMPALGTLPAAHGLLAMQAVNRSAVRAPLLTALLGTAAGAVVLTVHAAVRWQEPSSPLVVIGGTTYLFGVLGVTVVRHVPMNDALARLGAEATSPISTTGAEVWHRYRRRWTTWNHVRAVAGAIAAAVLLAARG